MLIVLCVVGILFAGCKLYFIYRDYKAGTHEYDALASLMLTNLMVREAQTASTTQFGDAMGAVETDGQSKAKVNHEPVASATTGAQKRAESEADGSASLGTGTEKSSLGPISEETVRSAQNASRAFSEAEEGEPTAASTTYTSVETDLALVPLIQLNFAPLLEQNADTVGWIVCDDSQIDYPVVKGTDNDYYLYHLFSGSGGIVGTIFMDMDNAGDFSDQNTVIYGHHMNDGSMFAGLSKYARQEYYEEHKTMWLYTPTGDYLVELFAGYNQDDSAIPHNFSDAESWLAYIAQCKARSDFASDVEVGADDAIVTLCTCSYVFHNARYVVLGKLVPFYELQQASGFGNGL